MRQFRAENFELGVGFGIRALGLEFGVRLSDSVRRCAVGGLGFV